MYMGRSKAWRDQEEHWCLPWLWSRDQQIQPQAKSSPSKATFYKIWAMLLHSQLDPGCTCRLGITTKPKILPGPLHQRVADSCFTRQHSICKGGESGRQVSINERNTASSPTLGGKGYNTIYQCVYKKGRGSGRKQTFFRSHKFRLLSQNSCLHFRFYFPLIDSEALLSYLRYLSLSSLIHANWKTGPTGLL